VRDDGTGGDERREPGLGRRSLPAWHREALVRRSIFGALTLTVCLGLVAPLSASAVDEVNTRRLRNAVTVGGILEHERVFQRIANRNDGTRASGTPGYDESVTYVARTLRRAGYTVRRQPFEFPFYRELAPAVLAQVSPTPTVYQAATFTYSGSGDVQGPVVPIDVQIPPPATPGSTSGCEAADFPVPPADPAVALIQRGTCTFEVKAANAQAAGYDAVVIFNEGQPGRTDLPAGTLGRPFDIPVVGASFADGSALHAAAQAGPTVVRVVTSTENRIDTTYNVLADSPTGNRNKVVVVGAHLDSVIAGPGINDNGSGSSTLLEIAEQMTRLGIHNRQQVRFAFWGAEELGLIGSEYYVANLTDRQLGPIYANLNFDMLGSPNYVRFVYDGDGSTIAPAGPPGSGAIESIFTDYFASQGLASEPTQFSGRSDYGPFIAVGIPAGGLFSGAEGIKTAEQAAIYGGTAGLAYDSCYHQACDTITNLSTRALYELGDAAAHAVMTLARSRSGLFEDGSRVAAAAPQRSASASFEGHVAAR
jgi:Zn-dependent M28 family amino/carboxypeptidase